MTHQVALTVISRIRPDETEALKQLLKAMNVNAAQNDLIPIGTFSTVHFARLLVLDQSVDLDGALIAPELILIGECDAPLNRFLDQLVSGAGEGLDRIYQHCEGYPAVSKITPAQRLAYLRANMVRAQAFYVNTVGRTVQQVHQEAQLREAIQCFLDRSDWSHSSALDVRAKIQTYVHNDSTLRRASRPPAPPSILFWLKETLHLVVMPLLLLILLPLLIPTFVIWLVLLRTHELSDAAPDVKPDDAHVQALAALEDHGTQNQFSAIGYIKPGRFRHVTVLTLLMAVDYAARHVFNKEDLAGVKTIHFARWAVLDGQRRVIFASNYDGSLESYMDDFIDKVAWGLNAVFSNGVGYPKTNWLIFDGAKNEQAFKNYIRVHQLPTQFWYSAYDHLTALNIANNARIRSGLAGDMSESDAEKWLRLL